MKALLIPLLIVLLTACAGPGLPGSSIRAVYENCLEDGRSERYCRNAAKIEQRSRLVPVLVWPVRR